MKKTRELINWLVAGGVALAMVTSLCAQTVKQRTATVVRVKGAARYSTGNNVWQPVKIGTKLGPGAIIQTAADSVVDFALIQQGDTPPKPMSIGGLGYSPTVDQDVVRVWEDSVVAIDKMTVVNTGADLVTDTQLDLRAGRIFGKVKKLSATSHFEIKLPNGVAGIRGTIFSVSVDGVLAVTDGSVVISWTAADSAIHTQEVPAGYQFDTRTGLMSPIPPASLGDMERTTMATNYRVTPPPTQFVVDHTLYYVSPSSPGTPSESTGGD